MEIKKKNWLCAKDIKFLLVLVFGESKRKELQFRRDYCRQNEAT